MYKKGQLVFAELKQRGTERTHVQFGRRPVVIIKEYGEKSTLLNVIPLSTKLHDFRPNQQVMVDTDSGLKTKSIIMVEQITTIEKKDILFEIGKLTKKQEEELDKKILHMADIKIEKTDSKKIDDSFAIELAAEIEELMDKPYSAEIMGEIKGVERTLKLYCKKKNLDYRVYIETGDLILA